MYNMKPVTLKPLFINLWMNGFTYTKLKFLLNGGKQPLSQHVQLHNQ